MIITIARECGSGGHVIANELASRFNFKVYDKEKLINKAHEVGMYDELETFFAEEPIDSILYSLVMGEPGRSLPEGILSRFRTLMDEDDFILIGRCGNYIFRDEESRVRIFLHADLEDEVERFSKNNNMSEDEARKLIPDIHEKRARYHKSYTNRAWGNAQDYEICLNTSKVGIDKSVELIAEYISAIK